MTPPTQRQSDGKIQIPSLSQIDWSMVSALDKTYGRKHLCRRAAAVIIRSGHSVQCLDAEGKRNDKRKQGTQCLAWNEPRPHCPDCAHCSGAVSLAIALYACACACLLRADGIETVRNSFLQTDLLQRQQSWCWHPAAPLDAKGTL